jgi:hypothetical protein
MQKVKTLEKESSESTYREQPSVAECSAGRANQGGRRACARWLGFAWAAAEMSITEHHKQCLVAGGAATTRRDPLSVTPWRHPCPAWPHGNAEAGVADTANAGTVKQSSNVPPPPSPTQIILLPGSPAQTTQTTQTTCCKRPG